MLKNNQFKSKTVLSLSNFCLYYPDIVLFTDTDSIVYAICVDVKILNINEEGSISSLLGIQQKMYKIRFHVYQVFCHDRFFFVLCSLIEFTVRNVDMITIT